MPRQRNGKPVKSGQRRNSRLKGERGRIQAGYIARTSSRKQELVQVDGEFGTLYGDGFPAVVEPVDAGDEGSLQLLNEGEKRSYKQMKEGTSDHDAAHVYWLSKVLARLADTEARAVIDDIPLASKGGNTNALVRALIKAACSEAGALFKDKIAAATSTKARHLNVDDDEEATKMILAKNYRQVFADVTLGVMTGHNMRTAKLSDLDTAAQFKLTVSNIGDMKCVKLSDEERVGDPESYSAQRLLHSLSVSGPCDLDADKLKELLAIALRKTRRQSTNPRSLARWM
jgi:hypothetical protein